jgi:hypothetical protein
MTDTSSTAPAPQNVYFNTTGEVLHVLIDKSNWQTEQELIEAHLVIEDAYGPAVGGYSWAAIYRGAQQAAAEAVAAGPAPTEPAPSSAAAGGVSPTQSPTDEVQSPVPPADVTAAPTADAAPAADTSVAPAAVTADDPATATPDAPVA